MNPDCPQLASVSSFVDDELPEEERASLLKHMEICRICSRELDDLKRLHTTLGSVGTDPLARQRILASLPLQPQARWFAGRKLSVPLPVAAAILLVLGISVLGNAYLGLQRRVKEPDALKKTDAGFAQGTLLSPGSAANPGRTPDGMSRPAVDFPGRKSSRSAEPLMQAGTPKPAADPFVITFESEQKTIQVTTKSDYRLNPSPKIYVGAFFSPQSERQ